MRGFYGTLWRGLVGPHLRGLLRGVLIGVVLVAAVWVLTGLRVTRHHEGGVSCTFLTWPRVTYTLCTAVRYR